MPDDHPIIHQMPLKFGPVFKETVFYTLVALSVYFLVIMIAVRFQTRKHRHRSRRK